MERPLSKKTAAAEEEDKPWTAAVFSAFWASE
jgi:hypothetical protein